MVVLQREKCSDSLSVSYLGLNTVAKQADPLCRINLHYNTLDFVFVRTFRETKSFYLCLKLPA